MSLADARSAIVAAWVSQNFITTVYENNIEEPTAAHAVFTFIPVTTDGVALGRYGQDETQGIAQIDLMYPVNTGNADILAKAKAITDYFYNGRGLTYNSVSVVINRVAYASPLTDNGWYRQTLSIYWYSRKTRA